MDRNEIKKRLERTLSQNKIVVPKNEESKPFAASPALAPAPIGTGGLGKSPRGTQGSVWPSQPLEPFGPTALGETKKEEVIKPFANTDLDNEVVQSLPEIYPNAEKRDRKLTNQDLKISLDGNKVDALKDDNVQADGNSTIIYVLSCFNCFNR
jgi:hypothetical protein